MLIDLFKIPFEENGISIKAKYNLNWEIIINSEKYCSVNYSSSFVDYQAAYFEDYGWNDASIQLYSLGDKKSIGVWPIFYKNNDDKIIIGSLGGPLISPLISENFDYSAQRKYYKICFQVLQQLWNEKKLEVIGFLHYNYLHHGISNWQMLIEYSCNLTVKNIQYESVINLELPLESLKSRLRKSYKGLINNGLKIWEIVNIEENQEFYFNQFRELHFQVSSGKTRNDKSWEQQLNNLRKGNAILIVAFNSENRMVGGAYFDITKYEANYSVGVYDRNLFDLPIGHAIQWRAIELFKSLGIKKYRVGIINRISNWQIPTNKELSISTFKSGFGGDLYSIITM